MDTPGGTESKRQALIALLFTAPAPSIGAAVAFFVAPGAAGNVVYALCKGVLYGMPLLWLWFVVREPIGYSPMRRGGLGLGVASGIGLGAVILAVYLLGARGLLDPAALRALAAESGFDTPGGYLMVAVWLCTVNALLEEYAFRWFLYGRCRALWRRWPAVLVGTAIFTAHHVIVLRAFFEWPIVALGSLGVFVGGLVWTWCYERYDSVWPGYVSHVLADVAILLIGWWLLFP